MVAGEEAKTADRRREGLVREACGGFPPVLIYYNRLTLFLVQF